jgi:hypothetical protein
MQLRSTTVAPALIPAPAAFASQTISSEPDIDLIDAELHEALKAELGSDFDDADFDVGNFGGSFF